MMFPLTAAFPLSEETLLTGVGLLAEVNLAELGEGALLGRYV